MRKHWFVLHHETEDCPQLLAKWQEKRWGNVHILIAMETGQQNPRICILMREDVWIGENASTSSKSVAMGMQGSRPTTKIIPI